MFLNTSQQSAKGHSLHTLGFGTHFALTQFRLVGSNGSAHRTVPRHVCMHQVFKHCKEFASIRQREDVKKNPCIIYGQFNSNG